MYLGGVGMWAGLAALLATAVAGGDAEADAGAAPGQLEASMSSSLLRDFQEASHDAGTATVHRNFPEAWAPVGRVFSFRLPGRTDEHLLEVSRRFARLKKKKKQPRSSDAFFGISIILPKMCMYLWRHRIPKVTLLGMRLHSKANCRSKGTTPQKQLYFLGNPISKVIVLRYIIF